MKESFYVMDYDEAIDVLERMSDVIWSDDGSDAIVDALRNLLDLTLLDIDEGPNG